MNNKQLKSYVLEERNTQTKEAYLDTVRTFFEKSEHLRDSKAATNLIIASLEESNAPLANIQALTQHEGELVRLHQHAEAILSNNNDGQQKFKKAINVALEVLKSDQLQGDTLHHVISQSINGQEKRAIRAMLNRGFSLDH